MSALISFGDRDTIEKPLTLDELIEALEGHREFTGGDTLVRFVDGGELEFFRFKENGGKFLTMELRHHAS